MKKNMLYTEKEFEDYCLEFYGPGEMYGDFFNNTLTREELRLAIKLRLSNKEFEFDGDSMDREIVRDIMLAIRGAPNVEHDVTKYLKGFFQKPKKAKYSRKNGMFKLASQ